MSSEGEAKDITDELGYQLYIWLLVYKLFISSTDSPYAHCR